MNTDKTSASFLSVFIGVHPWPIRLFGFGWYASSSSFHEIRSPETHLGAELSGCSVTGYTIRQPSVVEQTSPRSATRKCQAATDGRPQQAEGACRNEYFENSVGAT